MSSAAGLDSADVRIHNLALLMRLLVDGPSARSELAAATGLSRGTVTALVDVLSSAGLVRESAVVGSGNGRPKTMLALAADGIAFAAMQLDADQAIFLAHDLAGEELVRVAEHHGRPMGDPDAVLDVAAHTLGAGLDALERLGRIPVGFTVVMLAPVGGEPRIVLADTDLGWGQVDVLGMLGAREPRLPADTILTSDEPAALAEAQRLPGERFVLYLKSNSGIGGAYLADGAFIAGAHSLAGAIGHLPVDHDGLPCACGQRGCFVTVAGPDVVLAAAGLAELRDRDGLTAALAELVERVQAGDAAATAAFDAAAVWIARTIALLRMALDPSVIVLGGYWADLAPRIAAAAAPRLRIGAAEQLAPAPPIVAGRLGADAALLGALHQARDAAIADPLSLASR
ncbi:ROK family protein [Leifsonia sp. Le1]|uniref:ROK family protein n=1 Tax=Leifsonia sp. Le1 TaxID=3404918 RepID=UPI003EBEE6DA